MLSTVTEVFTFGPGVLQIEQHDHAKLGRNTGQCDEPDPGGDRQVESQQVEEPCPASQRERQRGHYQQGLIEAGESQVKQHEDDQQRGRYNQFEPSIGPLEKLKLS
ncbi:hypothetical protein D3C76_1113240 [compost metagenome]